MRFNSHAAAELRVPRSTEVQRVKRYNLGERLKESKVQQVTAKARQKVQLLTGPLNCAAQDIQKRGAGQLILSAQKEFELPEPWIDEPVLSDVISSNLLYAHFYCNRF